MPYLSLKIASTISTFVVFPQHPQQTRAGAVEHVVGHAIVEKREEALRDETPGERVLQQIARA